MGFQSVQCRILVRKLGFLLRVLDSDPKSVSGRVVETLSHDGTSSTCVDRECMELEESCGVMITNSKLGGQRSWIRCQKEGLRKLDREQLLKRFRVKAPVAAMVQERVGWLRLWDSVMNYRLQHIRGLQILMSNHGAGQHPSPLCRTSDLTITVLEHVLLAHGAEMGINTKTSYELLKTSPYLSVLLLNLETCLTMILISKPLVILLQTLYACSASAPCGRY